MSPLLGSVFKKGMEWVAPRFEDGEHLRSREDVQMLLLRNLLVAPRVPQQHGMCALLEIPFWAFWGDCDDGLAIHYRSDKISTFRWIHSNPCLGGAFHRRER